VKWLEATAEPEPAALREVRLWRSEQRRKMIESIQRLIDQAEKSATSQYTRSNQRARWTRLAGQLIWYKDQILRSMSQEAMEVEQKKLAERTLGLEKLQREQMKAPTLAPARTITKMKVGLPPELDQSEDQKLEPSDAADKQKASS